MKFLHYTKQFAAIALGATLFVSCDKYKEVDVIGDRGQTIVKAMKGGMTNDPGFNKFAIDFAPTPITLTVADIRRDVPNNTELSRVMTVVVKDDTAALRYYNDSIATPNGLTTFEYFPSTWYTIDASTPKVGGDGGTFTLNLQSGEFSKQIKITVPDATLLDPSTAYALPFTITTADASGVISTNRTVFATIGAKNSYDGKYHLNGQFYHPTRSPNYTTFEVDVEMWTNSANAVKMYSPDFAGFYHPFYDVTVGDINAFGAQEPRYTINGTTNKVVVDNSYSGAVTIYSMGLGYNNAGYDSRYEPLTKTIYACFGYGLGAGGVFAPAGAAREWIDTLVYTGPR